MVHIGNEWDELLKGEFEKEYYLKLRKFLAYEYKHARRMYILLSSVHSSVN